MTLEMEVDLLRTVTYTIAVYGDSLCPRVSKLDSNYVYFIYSYLTSKNSDKYLLISTPKYRTNIIHFKVTTNIIHIYESYTSNKCIFYMFKKDFSLYFPNILYKAEKCSIL